MNIQRQNIGKQMIKNILGYYHLFQYPLTLYEVFSYQYFLKVETGFTIQEIETLLEELENDKIISFDSGFYFLMGYHNDVQHRLEYYRYAIEKYNCVRFHSFWLRFLPGIKMIAVCNSLPLQNTKEDGDIDTFVVTASQRIWTTRFFFVLFLKLFNLRPTEKNSKNKLCPSFLVTEESLDLEPYQKGEDVYFRYWVSQVVAVYDQQNIFNQYWNKNSWVKKYLPKIEPIELPFHQKVIDTKFTQKIKKIIEKIVFLIPEKFFRKIQLQRLPQEILDLANKNGSSVVLNDAILKFHTKDRRDEFNSHFGQK